MKFMAERAVLKHSNSFKQKDIRASELEEYLFVAKTSYGIINCIEKVIQRGSSKLF